MGSLRRFGRSMTFVLLGVSWMLAGCGDPVSPPGEAPGKETPKAAPKEPAPAKTVQKPSPASDPAAGKTAPETPPAAAPVKHPWVTLKEAHTCFALDPVTGSLLGVTGKTGLAVLYPKSTLEGNDDSVAGSREVGDGVTSADYKQCGDRRCFVLFRAEGRSIEVLDASTLATVGRIPVAADATGQLSVSARAEDPMGYYVARQRVFRVRLDTFEDLGATGLEASAACVSPDGGHLYLRDPRDARAVVVYVPGESTPDDDRAEWTVVSRQADAVGAMVPDPEGQYMVIGDRLYDVELRRMHRQWGATPACFLRGRSVLLGLVDRRLEALSVNTFAPAGGVALPTGFTTPEPASRPPQPPAPAPRTTRFRPAPRTPAPAPTAPAVRLLADETHDRLIAVCMDRVFVQPLAELQLADEPRIGIELTPPATVLVDTKLTLPFRRASEACTVELLAGPAGMQVDGDTLVWTPGADQVGPAAFELKVKAGELERVRLFQTNVHRPYLRLPFVPVGVCRDGAGRYAAVWSPPTAVGGVSRSRLAVVDLRTMQVLPEKRTLYGIRTAVMDAETVYVATVDTGKIHALNVRDLSWRTEAGAAFNIWKLSFAGSEVLAAFGGRPVEHRCFSRKDLEPIASVLSPVEAELRKQWQWQTFAKLMGPGHDGGEAKVELSDVAGSVYTRGCLYSPDLGRMRMPVRVTGFPVLHVAGPSAHSVPLPWDRRIQGNEVRTGTGALIAKLSEDPVVTLMGSQPVGVMLHSTKDPAGLVSVCLTVHELYGFQTVARVQLMKRWPHPSGRLSAESISIRPRLTASGPDVVVTVGNLLFVYTPDAETLKQCPTPFVIQPLTEPVFVDPAGLTTLRHTTVGGEGAVEFDLSSPCAQTTIDRNTGTVTVDGPALLTQAVSKVRTELGKRMSARLSGDRYVSVDPRRRVAFLVETARESYRDIMGEDPRGVPWVLPIRVIASDRAGHMAWLDYQVFLLVPEERMTPEPDKPMPEIPKGPISPARLDV